MPFWGIEVKPGKSYAYSSDHAHRKLLITQASIGSGTCNVGSMLQINVGNKEPIMLCNLLPNVCENYNMKLEFEESEDVHFSVLGERSVHLAGYLIDSPDCKLDRNKPYFIGDRSDFDKYESDLTDDNGEITNSPSPKCTSEEISVSSPKKAIKIAQESNEMAKKKSKKSKEEKATASPSAVEGYQKLSAEPDEFGKKKKAKKQKETSEVPCTDKIDVNPSENGVGEKKKAKKHKVTNKNKMDESLLVSKAIDSEDVPTEQNARDVNKKIKKKKSKNERRCESDVAN